MPKTTFLDPKKKSARTPAARKQLADDLRREYGWCLTLTDVLEVLGKKYPKSAKDWIKSEGLEAVVINNRDHWLATDIARALDNSKIRGA